MTTGRDLDS